MPYKVGVTTGLYTIARSEELATTVRKLGYALTRGTSVVEIAGDVPHEVTQTEGRELRYIANKQGLEILWHGSLTIPMCMPERAEWRDAQDHMMKSLRSAVYAGAKYVNFHSCLNIWLELMTYAGRKLTMIFCDHEGNFIGKILKENKKLRDWFVENRWEEYLHDVLSREEITKATAKGHAEADTTRREETAKQLRAAKIPEPVIDYFETRNTLPPPGPNMPEALYKKARDIIESMTEEFSIISSEKDRKYIKGMMKDKLKNGKRWHSEELRGVVGVIDGYHIMAHYLFFKKDKMFVEMAKMYKDVLERYNLDYSNDNWVDEAWHEAEMHNDREFKEFFYAVVAGKFLQGHVVALDKWIKEEFTKKDLAKIKNQKEREYLTKIAKNIKIAIEIPDARDPQHAGLFLLWHPKQLYAAIKVIREEVDNRVWMLEDWEHLATQGLDPIDEFEKLVGIAPDMGEITLAVHANAPNPMHSHIPLELGDIRIYKLLYYMRKTGFGKDRKAYVIFERGGEKDPYQKSVAVLRLATRFLEQDIHPDELPEEYFGMKGPTAGDFHRQKAIMQDHAWEPLKDLLEIPEEEWTFLSQSAIKKGKKPDAWKKGEFR
ncbi:MAG: hypothetical protein DRO99_04250 [Candidatus Aenigmatarchaeota archaeon]|nr:MAG: hypothetical protein DRO99_04250 [Candidatus Aenigmarchaeota archaeon]